MHLKRTTHSTAMSLLAPLCLWGALLCWGGFSGAALPVVEGGQARAVIVRNTQGGKVTALAVEELRDHVEALTGVTLPVVPAAEWDREAPGTFLVVGQGAALDALGVELGELPPEGFRILALPERRVLVLAGRDQGDPLTTRASYRVAQEFGSLYAVYALLEHWGVRWLFPGPLGTVVPQAADLSAPPWDKTDGPDFQMRNHWLRGVTPTGESVSRADLDAEDPVRREAARQAHFWALRNRAGNSLDVYRGGHHSPRWWDLWSETHPEFLGLYRGQRGIRRSPPDAIPDKLLGRSKLCAGNPRAAEAVAGLAIEAFRKSSGMRVYSICEQDGSPGFCECPLCTALDAPAEGETPETTSLTDRYMVFWNRVAEQVAAEFPDRYLGVYLYSRYNALPRRGHALHPLLRAVFVANGEVDPGSLKRRIAGWSGLTPNPLALYTHPLFGAWPVQDFSGAAFPALTLANVLEGIRFCRDRGVVGFITDAGNFGSNTVGSHGVLAYAYARWLWDADLAPEEVLEDFARSAFGPAAETMLGFFTAIDRRQAAHPREVGREAWLEHHLQVFTPDFVAERMEQLDRARAEAATEPERGRILIFRQNLDYTAAELELERVWRRFEAGETGIGAVRDAFRRCETVYAELVPESRPQRPFFQQGDAARAMRLESRYLPLRVLPATAWELRADPFNEGVAQAWYGPGAAGDWRPVAHGGYDLQGLWGSDVRVWYRTRFEVPADASAERLRLGFRVQNSSADLYLNGQRIGRQVLGETPYQEPELGGDGALVPGVALDGGGPFVYDIGRQVRPGADNELAVRVWGYTDRGVLCQNAWLLQER